MNFKVGQSYSNCTQFRVCACPTCGNASRDYCSLKTDSDISQYCVRSLQMSYLTVLHVSSLSSNPKSVNLVFRLFGRGTDLLADKRFLIWNFLKRSGHRRVSMLGKLETEYRKAVLRPDRPTISSHIITSSVIRTSRVNSTPTLDPSLGRVGVSISRCSDSAQEDDPKSSNPNLVKGNKN